MSAPVSSIRSISSGSNGEAGWRLTDSFAKNPPPVPKGKNADDYIYFDDKLPRFGLRKRDGNLSWIVQCRVKRKTKRKRIGDADGPFSLTAKDARQQAEKWLADITLGGNPQSSRGSTRLGEIADRYLAGLDKGTIGVGRDRSRRIRPRSLSEIETHFRLHWSELDGWPIHEIDRKAVAKRLSEIAEKSGPVAANRARASLSGFFRWALGEGLAEANPVTGTNVSPEGKPRDRALTDEEITDIWNACNDDDHGRIVKLLILTGQRRQEVAAMADSEIYLTKRLWRLPAERTKNRTAHVVPLSDAALDIIAAQPRRVGRDLLFGDGAAAFSGWSRCKNRLDARIAAARKKARRKPMPEWVLHDLRRTVRTGLGKLGVLPHISEAVLNHLPTTLVQTYDRHDYTDDKRKALELWAKHVKKLVPDEPSNIVKIARAS